MYEAYACPNNHLIVRPLLLRGLWQKSGARELLSLAGCCRNLEQAILVSAFGLVLSSAHTRMGRGLRAVPEVADVAEPFGKECADNHLQ